MGKTKAALVGAIRRYRGDMVFRGRVGIWAGMVVDFGNVLFRVVSAFRFPSAWLASLAAYYLVFGVVRAYLVRPLRQGGIAPELVRYRVVACCLLLLNVPMGVMVVLMVRTSSGFSYPGYMIYLSALYTFYAFGLAISNVVRYRKVGSPILSAAKALSFVSALVSVLGLQTAMIAEFSTNADAWRMMMNAITGGAVLGITVVIALCMLIRGRRLGRGANQDEQV